MNKNKVLGIFISYLHATLPFLILITIIITNDLLNLFILLLILKLILIANYKCNDCPISIIENNYNNFTIMDIWGILTSNKSYNKDLRKHYTLNMLWIAVLIVIIKIVGIILVRSSTKFISKNICSKI